MYTYAWNSRHPHRATFVACSRGINAGKQVDEMIDAVRHRAVAAVQPNPTPKNKHTHNQSNKQTGRPSGRPCVGAQVHAGNMGLLQQQQRFFAEQMQRLQREVSARHT